MLGLIRIMNDIFILFENLKERALPGVLQNITLSGTAGGSTLSTW